MLGAGIGLELFLELAHFRTENELPMVQDALHAGVDLAFQGAVLCLDIGEFHQAADFRCAASLSRHSPIGAMPDRRSLPLSSTE